MKICILSLHFSEYAYRLASALAINNDVLLIVSLENFTQEVAITLDEAETTHLHIVAIKHKKLKNPFILFNVFKIVYSIRHFNPDVIHCQESLKDYQIMSLAFLHKYPFILTIHDHIAHTGTDSKVVAQTRFGFYRNKLRKYASAVIVHGNRIASETKEIYPRLKGRIFISNHGVLGRLPATPVYNWDQGLLLFFGRIEAYKGLNYFIDALDILNNRGVTAHGLIAGRGDALDSYRSRISGMPDCELLEEYIPNDAIPALFGRAHIVVLPYTDATQSGVASFALQYARPLVATNVGGLPEMVRDQYNGLLVPPCDATALADALEKILKNPSLSISMANNSRTLAETEYSWSEISENTLSIYKTVINEIPNE